MSQLSYRALNGTGGNITFQIDTFEEDEIKVYVDGVERTNGGSNNHDYTIPDYATTGGTVTWVGTAGGNAPTSSHKVRIVRQTDVLNAGNTAVEGRATYAAGSSVKAEDLNDNQKQVLRALQEHNDQEIQTYDIEDKAVTRDKIALDAIDGTRLADNAVDSEHYVDGSIDRAHLEADIIDSTKLADNAVNSEHYVDGSIDHVHLANDVVDGDNIQDNVINSEHYVDGSIDRVHLAADIVDGTKIADDSINSEHYVDDSIDTQHIAASQITTNELATNAVTTIKITDGNVTKAKLEADIIDGTKLADNAVDSEHYTDGSIDAAHLSDDCIQNRHFTPDCIDSADINAGALDNEHYAAGSITSDKLNAATVITSSEQGSATTNDTSFLTSAAADARFFNISSGETIKDGDTFPDNDTTIATTAAINDRIIDLIDDVGGFDIIESEQHFPNSNPQGTTGQSAVLSIKAASTNLAPSGTTVTISNGNLANNANIIITGVTSTIPTGFGFLVESTSTTHTYAFHRLVPKATEVTTIAGIASNITTVAGVASNVTTVAGISSNVTSVAGNATNINTVASNASNINAVAADASDIGVVAADGTDIGLVAGSITNVNNVGGSIANVNTVAGNLSGVNSFAARYRVESSEPGSNNDEGDLYFDTSSNELRVYNGSSWQGGVTATGNLAGLGANSFTGNQTISNTEPTLFLTDTNDNPDYKIHAVGGQFRITDTTAGAHRLVIHSSGNFDVSGNLNAAAGVDVTGNITVTGNVDGRDLQVDGAKLDNLPAGAIANTVEDTSPQLGGNLDTNGNYIFTSQSNGNIPLQPNGTGAVEIKGAGGNDGTLQLNCSANSHGVKIKSPAHSAAASYTLTLPDNDGSANEALITDGNGNLSFSNYYMPVSGGSFIDTVTFAGTNYNAYWNKPHSRFDLNDNVKITFGTSQDLTIFHNGSDSVISQVASGTGDLKILSGGAQSIECVKAGAVNIAHNGSTKLATTSSGVNVTGNLDATGTVDSNELTINGTTVLNSSRSLYNLGVLELADNIEARFGSSNDLKIYHDGNNSYIKENGTGNLYIFSANLRIENADGSKSYIEANNGGGTELYYDGSKKFETWSGGAQVTGSLHTDELVLQDNEKIKVGTGADLEIYHSGTHSIIKDAGTGNLQLSGSTVQIVNPAIDASMLVAYDGGAVELNHAGSQKLTTASSGISVTGNIAVSGTVDGRDVASDGSKLDGIATGATNNGSGSLSSYLPLSGGTLTGALTGTKLTLTDDGSSSPILNIRTDDSSPWAFRIGNDSYSSAEGHGYMAYQNNNGNLYTKLVGNGSYENWYFDQSNASTSRTLIHLDTSGAVNLNHAGNGTKGYTTSSGFSVNGTCTATTFSGSGASLTSIPAGNLTGTLPAISGANLTNLPGGGKVLQVVHGTLNGSFGTGQSTYQATGCSVSITMSDSNNKVLVMAGGTVHNSSAGSGAFTTIYRGSTNISDHGNHMAGYWQEDNSNNPENSQFLHTLDTPGSGTHTYQVYIYAHNGYGTASWGYRNTGVITAMEIEA